MRTTLKSEEPRMSDGGVGLPFASVETAPMAGAPQQTVEEQHASERQVLDRNCARPGGARRAAGTAVMTVFQKLVEMPLSQRQDSYAPAAFAERLLPFAPDKPARTPAAEHHRPLRARRHVGHRVRRRGRQGLRGQKAVNAVFAAVYTGDVLLNTALGLYQPRTWTAKDWAVDLVDKYVQALATGAVFDRALDPARQP